MRPRNTTIVGTCLILALSLLASACTRMTLFSAPSFSGISERQTEVSRGIAAAHRETRVLFVHGISCQQLNWAARLQLRILAEMKGRRLGRLPSTVMVPGTLFELRFGAPSGNGHASGGTDPEYMGLPPALLSVRSLGPAEWPKHLPCANEVAGDSLGAMVQGRSYIEVAEDPALGMTFITVVWSPIAEAQKLQELYYTDEACRKTKRTAEWPLEACRRAAVNRWVKEDLIDGKLADAIVYLGAQKASIQTTVGIALCAMQSRSPSSVEAMRRCKADWSATPSIVAPRRNYTAPGCSPYEYAFITHSLGSRILFDTLTNDRVIQQLPCIEPKTRGFYMLANQLPLLELTESGTRKDLAVYARNNALGKHFNTWLSSIRGAADLNQGFVALKEDADQVVIDERRLVSKGLQEEERERAIAIRVRRARDFERAKLKDDEYMKAYMDATKRYKMVSADVTHVRMAQSREDQRVINTLATEKRLLDNMRNDEVAALHEATQRATSLVGQVTPSCDIRRPPGVIDTGRLEFSVEAALSNYASKAPNSAPFLPHVGYAPGDVAGVRAFLRSLDTHLKQMDADLSDAREQLSLVIHASGKICSRIRPGGLTSFDQLSDMYRTAGAALAAARSYERSSEAVEKGADEISGAIAQGSEIAKRFRDWCLAVDHSLECVETRLGVAAVKVSKDATRMLVAMEISRKEQTAFMGGVALKMIDIGEKVGTIEQKRAGRIQGAQQALANSRRVLRRARQAEKRLHGEFGRLVEQSEQAMTAMRNTERAKNAAGDKLSKARHRLALADTNYEDVVENEPDLTGHGLLALSAALNTLPEHMREVQAEVLDARIALDSRNRELYRALVERLRGPGDGVHLQVVAFSDPNDLLTYPIPTEEFGDEYDSMRFSNVTIRTSWELMWAIGDPMGAHTGHLNSEAVASLLVNGCNQESAATLSSRHLREYCAKRPAVLMH